MNLFTNAGRGLILLGAICWAMLQGCAGPAAETLRQPPLPVATCGQPNTAVREYFDLIRTADPAFVKLVTRFPKGGDIHNHLSGSVMPEDYIDLGIRDSDCYGPAPDKPGMYEIRPNSGAPGGCRPDDLPLVGATAEERHKLVKSLSMYQFDYSDIQSGHDQFFAVFGRLGAVSNPDRNVPSMLVKMLQQADADNVSYVETMVSFRSAEVGNLSTLLNRQFPDPSLFTDSRNYPGMYDFLLRNGLKETVAAAQQDISRDADRTKALLHCGNPGQDRACDVAVAFQAAMNRNSSQKDGSADLPKMFTQAAFTFLLSRSDPRVVGVNLVSGEDMPVSMGYFTDQMQFISYFHERFPDVNIALHAGEITPCFVGAYNPALKGHLAGSIKAGAKRLGHAVSFEYLNETDRAEVADLMKKNATLVEIPFTSNAQILGVAGDQHPFPVYFRKYGIPAAFATDDEGVSHANYTDEWVYAFMKYGLTYDEAVRLARFSIQYSFLPGAPLWKDAATAAIADPCTGVPPGGPVPAGSSCAAFLQGSKKAEAQWEYETKLARFDRAYGNTFRRYLGGLGK